MWHGWLYAIQKQPTTLRVPELIIGKASTRRLWLGIREVVITITSRLFQYEAKGLGDSGNQVREVG
jgi:hypothetical protein